MQPDLLASTSTVVSLFNLGLLQIMPGTQLPSGMVTPLHGRVTAGSRPLSSQSDAPPSATRCPLLCYLLLPFADAFQLALCFALC